MKPKLTLTTLTFVALSAVGCREAPHSANPLQDTDRTSQNSDRPEWDPAPPPPDPLPLPKSTFLPVENPEIARLLSEQKIGETHTGFLQRRAANLTDSEVEAIRQVNLTRLEHYRELAESRGSDPESIGREAAARTRLRLSPDICRQVHDPVRGWVWHPEPSRPAPDPSPSLVLPTPAPFLSPCAPGFFPELQDPEPTEPLVAEENANPFPASL